MYENLYRRTKAHFDNTLMLAATFMDPRYRSFKFIKDQNERDVARFKAQAYIKMVYANIFKYEFILKLTLGQFYLNKFYS